MYGHLENTDFKEGELNLSTAAGNNSANCKQLQVISPLRQKSPWKDTDLKKSLNSVWPTEGNTKCLLQQ